MMTAREFNLTIFEEGFGAAAIAAMALTSPLSRAWYGNWGSSQEESEMALPGDELVPLPKLQSTRAITIEAAPGAIWPWLAQMGQGRGGLYSYQKLENLAGCRMRNADRILPEHQEVQIGDSVALGPEGYPQFEVMQVEPGRSLVLRGLVPGAEDKPITWVWSFFLKPVGENETRLILRTRLYFGLKLSNVLTWRVVTDPVHFVMERKMLQGIKARAEAVVTG